MTCVNVWFEVFGGLSLIVIAYDIWEGHVTTRSDIYIDNVHSLELRDLRKGVTLRRTTLHNLEFTLTTHISQWTSSYQTSVQRTHQLLLGQNRLLKCSKPLQCRVQVNSNWIPSSFPCAIFHIFVKVRCPHSPIPLLRMLSRIMDKNFICKIGGWEFETFLFIVVTSGGLLAQHLKPNEASLYAEALGSNPTPTNSCQ